MDTFEEDQITDLDVAESNLTHISEDRAWAAFRLLQTAEPEENTPFPSPEKDLRERSKRDLESYVSERRLYDRPLFPTRTARANSERAAYHRGLFTKPLSEVLPADAAAGVDAKAKLASDPDRYRSRQVLKTYLNDIYGAQIPAESYDRARDLFAQQQLGLKDDTSDKAVFSAMRDRYNLQDEAERTLSSSFDQIAPAILTGDIDLKAARAKWKEIAPGIPEPFRGAAEDEFNTNVSRALYLRRRVLPVVRSLTAYSQIEMDRGDNISATKATDPQIPLSVFQAADILNTLIPSEREAALGMIGSAIAKLPEDQRGTLSRAFQASYNTGQNLGSGLYDFWDSLPGGPRRSFEKFDEDMRARKQLMGLTQSKSIYRSSDSWLQKGTIGLVGNAPNLALFFAGSEALVAGQIGMVTLAISTAGDSYSTARVENPKGDPLKQMAVAELSGGVQAWEEQVMTEAGVKLLKGRIPGLTGVLNRLGILNKYARASIGGAAAVAGAATTEYGEEVIQSATDRALQDLALKFSGIRPSTDWVRFFKDWSPTSGSRQSQDTLAAVLPYALIGAGAVGSFNQFQYGNYLRQNSTVLRALGATEEQVKAITTGTDPAKVDEDFRAAFDEAQKRHADAAEISRKERFRTALAEEMEAAAQALEAAGIPIIGQETNGFTGETQHFLQLPNQPKVYFDSRQEALEGWRTWQIQIREDDLDILHDAAVSELADHLTGEGSRSEGTRVVISDQAMTPDAAVKKGIATTEQMRARLELFALHEGLTAEAAAKEFKKATIAARSFSEIARDGTTRYTVELYRGADPVNVLEDMAEDAWKRGVNEGFLTPDMLVGWLRQTEDATGNSYLPSNYQHDAANPLKLFEALSMVSREYALGQIRNPQNLPEKFRAWLEMIVAFAAHTFSHIRTLIRSNALGQAMEAGKIDAKFIDLVRDSVGLNTEATEHRLRQKMESQMAAEAMGGFPEISESAKGLLPHPQTLRARNHPLAGEVQRLWESLKTPTRRRRKDGGVIDATQRANAYFLPPGEMADLDDIRNALNEKGFEFETPADMLDALDSSMNYGRPVYGTGSNTDPNDSSFSLRAGRSGDVAEQNPSIGRTTILSNADTEVKVGSGASPTVVGPATFAIAAFHGTPFEVDRFSTDKIGTGEGFQAFGWGLYFAGNRKVAEQYRDRLSKDHIDLTDPHKAAWAYLSMAPNDRKAAIDLITSHLLDPELGAAISPKEKEGLRAARNLLEIGEEISPAHKAGNLYRVELRPDENDLLDWDKPFALQSEQVRAALDRISQKLPEDFHDELNDRLNAEFNELTGREIYKVLQRWASEDALPGDDTAGGDPPRETSAFLHREGIPGIRFLDGNSRKAGEGTSNYVVFDEADISITGDTDTSFSIARPGAGPVKDGFYSKLERGAADKLPNSSTPQQILATLDPSRGLGIKAEELKWSGLAPALDRMAAENGGKVSRDAVLEYLQGEGAIRFEQISTEDKSGRELLQKSEAAAQTAGDLEAEARAAMDEGGASQVQRVNIVRSITNPLDEADLDRGLEAARHFAPGFDWESLQNASRAAESARQTYLRRKRREPLYKEYVLPGGENYREMLFTLPGDSYESRHFPGVEGYVAHLRVDDRADASGRPGLFLEEIQSDRHQEGRTKGYTKPLLPEDAPIVEALKNYDIATQRVLDEASNYFDEDIDVTGLTDDVMLRVSRAAREAFESAEKDLAEFPQADVERVKTRATGVPDAPFRKDWPLQMFKRALREAVASGKEWIGWTTGETQAKRYDLSQQVEDITYWKPDRPDLEGDRYGIMIHDKSGKMIFASTVATLPEIADTIGKELADKIAREAQPTTQRLSGLDLQVGGEGLKGFYDKILPSEIAKYVRQWGAKVEKGEVATSHTQFRDFEAFKKRHLEQHPTATPEQTEAAFRRFNQATAAWRVNITEEMRVGVEEGQPSFAISKKGLQSLEAAIAQRMNQGPQDRIEFFERVRNRLDHVLQRFEDSENGIGQFARSVTEDPVELERRRISEAMAEANAIVSALPSEVRAKVSLPTAEILNNATERGKIGTFKRLLADADEALEVHLRGEYATAIENLFDLAKPSLSASRQLAGKLTPETQRLMDQALGYAVMTPTEVAAETLKLETQIATIEDGEGLNGTPAEVEAGSPEHIELLRAHDLLETFGAISSRSAADMEQALEHLTAIYSRGRTARRILDHAQRESLNAMRSEIIGDVGKPSQPEHSKRTADAGTRDFLSALRLGLSSFHQVMEALFPNSAAARTFQDRIRAADRSFTRGKIEAKSRMERFFADTLGAVSKRKRDGIIYDLTIRHDAWNIEIREGTRFLTEKLSEDQAAGVLDGTIKPGWETDPIAMESLRQALADFRLRKRRDKARATFVRFQRLVARGTPAFLHLSHLEAAYFLQLAGQAEYLPTLDRYGFTREVLKQFALKIDPRAAAIQSYLSREYASTYDRINAVFRSIFGFDMPRIRNYAPGLFEHLNAKPETGADAFGGGTSSVNAMSSGFTKARQHHMARPQQTNALAAYWSHLEQSEYYIAYAEVLRDMRAIFRNPQVRRAIEGRHGTRVASLFSQWLDAFEVDGKLQATSLRTIAEMSSNALATQAAIGLAFNVGTWLKQGSAATGTMFSMPFRDFVSGFIGALRNPGSLKQLWATETIQQRVLEGISPEDRKLLDAAKSKPSVILDLLQVGRLPIAWVDAALTSLSGSVAYQFHKAAALRNNLSEAAAEEFALRQFDRAVLQYAQPSTTQDKSMAEITASNAIAKAMIMFKSDPRQKFALAAETVSKLFAGKIGLAEAGRKLLVSWVLYGVLAQVGGDIWGSISKHDDDPERWNWKNYLASAVAGPLSGVTYVGSAMEFGIRKLITGRAYTNNPSPIDSAAEAALKAHLLGVIKEARKGSDVTFDEVMKAAVADSRAIALILGAKDPRFAAVPVAIGMAQNLAGLAENTIDLFDQSVTQKKRETLAAFTLESRQRSKEQAESNSDELAAFRRMAPDQQNARILELARTDRQKAMQLRREAALRALPKVDRDLVKLEPETRAKAVKAFLKILPEGERDAYLKRLIGAGVVSKDIMQRIQNSNGD